MKLGPIILIIGGLGLLTFLYFSPVTPKEKASIQEEETQQIENIAEGNTPDQLVDEALRQLQSGELPPMQAILKIRAVAEEHPQNVKANFTLGVMSMKTNQFEKAIERFEKVLAVDKSSGEAYRLLAQSYLQLGDKKSARENYLKALEHSTENREVIEQEMTELNIN